MNGVYNPNDNDETNPASSSSSSSSSSVVLPQCSDNIDNDNDGMRDMADPGCYANGVYNPNDNDETNVVMSSSAFSFSISSSSSSSSMTSTTWSIASSSSSSSISSTTYQCWDGIDNDHDGAIDMNDFSCSGPNDNDEMNPRAACQDGYDNDSDGRIDYPQDPGCVSNQDNDEWNAYSSISSSSASSVSTSSSPHAPQCSDGLDNDTDGRIDYPSDAGCFAWFDDDEYNQYSSSSSSNSSIVNNGFHLNKRASTHEVFPGGTVAFTLEVRNDTGRDVQNVTVHDRFDDRDLMVIDDGDADEDRNGELAWRLGTMRAGQREEIRYVLRVANGVYPGDSVRNDAWAEGSGVRDDDSVTVSVIGSLPQTGFFSRISGTKLTSLSGTQQDASLPVAFFLSLAMMGIAGGAYAAKKIFTA